MHNIQQQIHDIRKPLNAISMQAELIKMLTEASENAPQLKAAADKIIHNSKLCSEQLQQLFDELSNTNNNDDASISDAK